MKFGMRSVWKGCAVALLAVAGLSVQAQEAAPASNAVSDPWSEAQFFELHFTVREVDEHGTLLNARSFEAMTYGLADNKSTSLGVVRQEAEVPVLKDGVAIRYIELLTKINFGRIRMTDAKHLELNVTTDIQSLLPGESASSPVTRSVEWTGDVMVPIGEHRIVFSSDDVASKHTLQLELLVTRVK